MEVVARATIPEPVSERQLAALIRLLVDEDPKIYRMIRAKLLSLGPGVCEWLRRYTLSPDAVLRRRCREIIHQVGRERGDERFLDFCLHHGEELNLEEAVFRMAETEYPEINLEAYGAQLDAWAAELRGEGRSRPGEEILCALNEHLFGRLGFAGNPFYGDNAENCYLNRVMDRRTGNPISLCAVYLFLGRRLGLPLTGIGLPGHFICRYQSTTRQIYVDVFRRGQFLTKGDCIKYLVRNQHGLQEGYLAPVTPRRMLLRMCSNLHQTYNLLEMPEEVTRVQRYIVALAR